ncbi:MAG: ATP-dependent Clp protease ATP-binding subunit [Candidatus Andersenbacteria bacterium]|nr:ATP-dependent Clp protease ATP-binding subunit [Candidatus Andersenbacteria bacterium]
MADGGNLTQIFNPRRRLQAVQTNEALSVVSAFVLIGAVTAAVAGAITGYFWEGFLPISLFVLSGLCASVALVAGWLFVYTITFVPRRLPSTTLPTKNGADAADFGLLLAAQTYKKGNSKEFESFCKNVLRTSAAQMVLKRLQLSAEEVVAEITTAVLPNYSWDDMGKDAAISAQSSQYSYISATDALAAFLLHPQMHMFLRRRQLQEEDIRFAVWWEEARRAWHHQRLRWWSEENLLDFTGIGISWAAGFTPLVDQFSRPPRGSAWDIGAAHPKQVDLLINSLARRRQSNVLLVGQPGVGRIGVIKEVMRRIAAGTAHPALESQRVLYVHVSQLISGGNSRPQQIAIVSRALNEMERAGNVIVVLDGLSGALGGGEGVANITDVLVPFFSSPTVRVVAVMSLDDYHQRLAGNSELEHLFEIVEVPPLSEERTLKLLALMVEQWEKKSGVFLPYRTLEEIVKSTASILPHIPFPEKAFDVLEEVVVEAEGSKTVTILPEDVDAVITRKTGIDFGKVRQEEAGRLLSLADQIHRRVVNQHEGVEAVSRAMIRARAGVRSGKHPIGTFLFLGPTGVGKTETAKALAEAYFGAESYLQRLDMSEFQGSDAIERLIGTVGRPIGRLTGLVAEHPFSVILLDEFEKASVAVQELFLPLLDEGYITDARGRKYSFVHSIIIATSNAGAELIRTSVTDDGTFPPDFDTRLREHILQKGIFLPELLNRFDGVVTFVPLSAQHIREVAIRMMTSLNARLDAQHGITIAVTDELINYLAATGYDPEFGARPMKRLIQDKVEYWIAQQLIAGRVEGGQQLTVPVSQF